MAESPAGADVRALLAEKRMSLRQWLAVLLCVVTNILDGFEILAAGYTAPAIASEFALSTRWVGLFLSVGPVGMIIGALALSPLADMLGRRRLVLVCLTFCAVGMLTASMASGIATLLAARLLTGTGVGGVMVAINTVVAEVTNRRRKDLALILQATGFPLGGAVCGFVASIIPTGDWRHVYGGGVILATALFPFVLIYLPESLEFLLERKPRNALAGVRDVCRHFGLPEPATLFTSDIKEQNTRARVLFSPESVMVSISFFMVMVSFYFLSSWAPKLLAAAGSAQLALSGAALVSAGGVVGDLVFAALMLRWRAREIGPVFSVGCFVSAISLALSVSRTAVVPIAALFVGFFLYGSVASHYAVVPRVYATDVRASGSGIAIGSGRVGAAVGPFVGGLILATGTPVLIATVFMSLPVLLCAVALPRAARYS